MKQLQFLLVALACMVAASGYSQNCPDEVSTDPRSPNNLDRPEFENNFYWFPHNGNDHASFEILTSGGTYPSINNPFWVPTNLMVGQLVNLQNSDFYPEDGWELLKVNFGRLNDGSARVNKPSMPYMILYNRYTGTMRFLGMWPDASNSWQIIRFQIGILDKKWTPPPSQNGTQLQATNLLSVQGDAIQPLDQQTEETVYEVITEYPGISNASFFFWFDLPVAYDPCICNNDVAIQLDATVENQWDVTVKGVLDAQLIQQGVPANGHSSLVAKRIIGAAGATVAAIASGGSVVNVGAFTGLLDIFSQRPGVSDDTQEGLELLQGVLNAAAEVTYDPGKLEWRNTVTGDTLTRKDWEKLFSGIGSFLNAGVDFANPGSQAGKPKTSVVGTITATGTATLNQNTGDLVYLAVPGSEWTSSLDEVIESTTDGLNPEYPIYNNPLGTFSLLKTPTLKVKTDEIDLCVNVRADELGNPEYGRLKRTVFTLFFDNEEFLYYFNPILNKNDEDLRILASIVVKSKNAGFQRVFYGDENGTECIASQHGLDEFKIFRGTNLYSSVDNTERISYPVQLDFLNDMVVGFTGNDGNLSHTDYDFFIRFNISGNSTDLGKNGLANRVDQVLSFPLHPEGYTGQVAPPIIDLDDIPIEIVDLQNYHQTYNPYVLPLVFQSNQPVPYQPGNEAWHDELVEIHAQISSPSQLSTVSSEVGIKLSPGARISPSTHLKIGVPLQGAVPQAEATSNYVSDFCQNIITNNQYQANQFSALAPQLPSPSQDFLEQYYRPEQIQNKIEFSPNPASDLLSLRSSHLDMTSITIHDLSGRPIKQQNLQAHSRETQINLADIAPGTYIVRVDCGDEVFSEKLVVTK